jgi:hypothetical protein
MDCAQYARAIEGDGVYTPQVIVNGRVEGTGLDANELASLMRSAGGGDSGSLATIRVWLKSRSSVARTRKRHCRTRTLCAR